MLPVKPSDGFHGAKPERPFATDHTDLSVDVTPFSEWLDEQLWALEIAYKDFVTSSSIAESVRGGSQQEGRSRR